MDFLEKFFALKSRKSNLNTEFIAGLCTFAATSYIIFLQPAIMSGTLAGIPSTSMDISALITTTCLIAGLASILMGVLANYPLALAPGMGENFFFVLCVVPFCAKLALPPGVMPWQTALGVVFAAGVIFLILSLCNIRKLMMNALSPNLRFAITGGIGLFIALIGLRNSTLIYTNAAGYYSLTHSFRTVDIAIFFSVLLLTALLRIYKVKGAVLIGMIGGAIMAFALGRINIDGFFSLPPDPMPILGKIDFTGLIKHLIKLLPFIIIFCFMDIFDTMATLVGVATQANLMRDNKLPDAEKVFAADAIATVGGAFCGHSTITAYIESGTGVEAGGRTGLTAVTVGVCFLLSPFFTPLIKAVSTVGAISAPALIIVGIMMLKNISEIQWSDFSEALPAFTILVGIPFFYSIADGMLIGFILYPVLKIFSGKWREISYISYIMSIMLILYALFIRM